ncbi:MAG: transposase [Spirochaetaceae bacterium]|jgi:REP element-mobilizing transposase RayT|nr:transposase [Spirochaetaceae bacterium]
MRRPCILEPDSWYEVRAVINNRQPVFESQKMVELFQTALSETGKLFLFELRELSIEASQVTMLIKPLDETQLPKIMQRVKQTFAARYNAQTGRHGHVWAGGQNRTRCLGSGREP